MRKGILFAMVAALLLAFALNKTQADDNLLGLSRAKVLAMTPEQWAEYYNKKNPGGEVGYDDAYGAYANCLQQRTDVALKKLPSKSGDRIRKYRELCGKFRVDEVYLQQAYAGGGTMYTHGAARGRVVDEQLIERLVKVYQSPGTKATGNSNSVLARIARRVAAQNPSREANQQKLAEFSMVEQGKTAYGELRKDLSALSAMLSSERPDARRPIVKFLEDASVAFDG